MTVVILFVIFAFLQGLDGYSTLDALHTAGNYELNPAITFLAKYIGIDFAIFGIKTIATAFIGYLSIHFRQSNLMVVLLILLNALYAYIVIHNFSLVK